jgi:tetratricopeptide (TPR) repeat protein
LIKREEAKGSLRQGHKLLAQGKYEEALNEFQKARALSNQKPPEDEALFNIGLIYASSRYPQKDYKRSMSFFTEILNDYPQSPLVEQARIWLGILHENEKMSLMMRRMRQTETKQPEAKPPEAKPEDYKEVQEYVDRSQRLLATGDYERFINENQRVLSLPHPRSPKDEALFNLGLVYAHAGNPKKDFGRSLDFFKRLISEYPRSPLVEQAKIWVGILEEYEGLTKVIDKLKQVDIEIEERKREKVK